MLQHLWVQQDLQVNKIFQKIVQIRNPFFVKTCSEQTYDPNGSGQAQLRITSKVSVTM